MTRLAAVLVGAVTVATVAIIIVVGVTAGRDEPSDREHAQRTPLTDLVDGPVRVTEEFMTRLRECRRPRSVVVIPRTPPGYCDVLDERGVHPNARRLALPDEPE